MSNILPKETQKIINDIAKEAISEQVKKMFENVYNTDKRVHATIKKVYFNKDFSIKGIDVYYKLNIDFKELEKWNY